MVEINLLSKAEFQEILYTKLRKIMTKWQSTIFIQLLCPGKGATLLNYLTNDAPEPRRDL